MRLKKIIISGFKSFVDHTTITFPANVVGIVGPNGCGKSNVIDAIRWVMGESSAKTLRGESMTDVIFNGSAARKPVGRASVELVFDNGRGRAPGLYAQYAEISVKRSLSRDGQADYILNHNKVRRRDITDLFLGTGLGPRSYSIIEQGMVSRIVEARPEDLRSLVEEAAGISRYKERRRETENRIRHTRENLQRVEDIRHELESHLRKLKRQASAARQYKKHKEQQRQLRGQLLALQWQSQHQKIKLQEQTLGQLETALQEAVAGQRTSEAHIEAVRADEFKAQEWFNLEQKSFYTAGEEIAKLEQQLQYYRQTRQQQQQRLQDNKQRQQALQQQQEDEKNRLNVLQQRWTENSPAISKLTQQVEEATRQRDEKEAAQIQWQEQWQQFSREAAIPAQQRERHKSRIQALQRQLQRSSQRLQRLQTERAALLAEIEKTDATGQQQLLTDKIDDCKTLETTLESIEATLRELRIEIRKQQDQKDKIRNQLQDAKGRLLTLQELQAAARGDKNQNLQQWLQSGGFSNASRLSDHVSVQHGWEQAADQVLGERLRAIVVETLDALRDTDWKSAKSTVTFIEAGTELSPTTDDRTLCAVVSSGKTGLESLLHGIQRADNLSQALELRQSLQSGQSLVTPEGIWLGRNWVRFPATTHGAGSGILTREATIKQLDQEARKLELELSAVEQRLTDHRGVLTEQEKRLITQRQHLRQETETRNRLQSTCSRLQAHVHQLGQRQLQIDQELSEIESQSSKDQTDLGLAEADLQDSESSARSLQQQQLSLIQQRDALSTEVSRARQYLAESINQQHQAELQHQQTRSSLETTTATLQRLQTQREQLQTQQQETQQEFDQLEQPIAQITAQIAEKLQVRLGIEERLQKSRQQTSTITDQLHHLSLERSRHIEAVEKRRQTLDDHRLQLKEQMVRSETLVDQLRDLHQDLQEVLDQLPDDLIESCCQQQLDQVTSKMERLGQVNLVAIEEFEEETKRKEYYDSQSDDLNQALDMLTAVIRNIDKDTRQRFKETFEALDQQYQLYFPKLFGAGKAHLELSDEDLLTAGVRVMARPPGKRNSTIHLLSGGEKALAAVALIFAFFELNPAPFCVLDEVDAPLDDANVERFCQALGKIAEQTQLLFISHNKIAMESADVLIGVTMSEAGVSRLVSVDIEQAMQMAAIA